MNINIIKLFIATTMIVVPVGASGGATETAEERTTLDCGVNALFVLFALEGRPVEVDRLISALPPRHPKGYSMSELSKASRSLGLTLEGIRSGRGDPAPTRPAIAFLENSKGGHFAILRPVGTTRTMVQVIDPPSTPWIVDYDQITKTDSWTGRILMPRSFWKIPASSVVILGIALLGIVGLSRRLRSVSNPRLWSRDQSES